MPRLEKALFILLVIESVIAPFACFYAGKEAALEELVNHPGACAIGQMVETPSGVYVCFQSNAWKKSKAVEKTPQPCEMKQSRLAAYIDREKMQVTAINGEEYTVVRGVDGTKADSHATGALIFFVEEECKEDK